LLKFDVAEDNLEKVSFKYKYWPHTDGVRNNPIYFTQK